MKKSLLRTIVIAVLAIAAVYGAVMFVGCGGGGGGGNDDNPPPPPPVFKGNVFLDSIISATTGTTNPNYKFLHGSTSPDGKKMFVTVNLSDVPMGAPTGEFVLYMLDAVELEKGNVVKLAEGSITGKTGQTSSGADVTFRSTWTSDGTKIALASGDRFFVISAESSTLAPLNGANGDNTLANGLSAGTFYHNHDALPTSDGKYALLTIRSKPHSGGTTTVDDNYLDGELMLYSMQTGSYGVVGKSVSVCNACHINQLGANRNATHCGIDGSLTLQTSGPNTGKYTGTVYVAGHGGHFAKADLVVDPSSADPATVITVSTLDKLTVSASKFSGTGTASDNTSQYKLHDPRLDGNTLYWSTYNTDANSKVHYGKTDLTTGNVTADIAVDVDAKATIPSVGIDKSPIYCGSGQTATAFMPMTMTNKAYITVIPKADIK